MAPFDDEPFDPDAVEAGAWAPGPFGPGDVLGSYREVDPVRVAAALALLDTTRPVRTFHLGATLHPGFPAWGDRRFEQVLVADGLGEVGLAGRPRPRGANRLSALEERVSFTFNMGTKVNGLHHCGVGRIGYGGRDLAEVARQGGEELDTTTWGPPLVTRGLLVDLVGLALAEGNDAVLDRDPEGTPHLVPDHRVTIDDLERATARQGLPAFEPGDAIVLHTGWQRLATTDPERYRSANPGPYLAETRWLASFRPALVGSDTWCFETLAPAVTRGLATPCHQELMVRFGIRLAEGLDLSELVEAGVDRFVFCHAPLRVRGAVSSNSPPFALAN